MAKTSTTQLTIQVTGDGVTLSYTPLGAPMVNTNAPAGGPSNLPVILGHNPLTPPASARALLIVPGAIAALTIKGVNGDTGVPLGTGPSVLALPPTPGALVLDASAADTIQLQWL